MSTTLKKALKIFETLAASERPRGISELSREIDLNKSAVQRIFKTLEETGYLEKVPNASRYKLTLKVWEVGSQVVAQNELRRQIHPILRYGAKTTRLTLCFVIAKDCNAIYLDKVEGERGRLGSSEPGRHVPIHLTASGKAILANLPRETQEDILEQAQVPVDRRKELLAELQDIRRANYSYSISGAIAGVNSVAAPVWGNNDLPVGSICVTGDSGTMLESDLKDYGQQAIALADQATRVIGGIIPGLEDEHP